MLTFILLVLILILIGTSYRYYHRQIYINFDQFYQFYCQQFVSSMNYDGNYSQRNINMFDKCENDNNYHIKSSIDYLSVYSYIKEFLCHNSEHTNKSGPVCPFPLKALKEKSIYFYITNDRHNNKERLIQIIQQCRYDFLRKLKPTNDDRAKSVYKCLIMLIRSSDVSHALIDEIQIEFKPTFIIEDGLMFGEFHQSSNSSSIRNENFYPLRTQVPLLVIRYMVADDIIFLNQKQKYSLQIRRNMVKKYLDLYHSGLLYRSKANHLQNANDILEELNSSVCE